MKNFHPFRKISIIGLGRFGSLLAKSLLQLHEFELTGTTRSKEKKDLFPFDVEIISDRPRESLKADIIIINIPPFSDQLRWFQSWNLPKTCWPIFISSISALSKSSAPSSEILKSEEEFFKIQHDNLTIIRPGGIIFHESHPGFFLSGKKNIKGKNWNVNLIHVDDLVDATVLILKNNLIKKEFNVVFPNHPQKKEFYTQFCLNNKLPLPEFDETDVSTKTAVNMSPELREFFVPKRDIYHIG